MPDLFSSMRTGNSPAVGVPDVVAVAINASGMQLGAAVSGTRRVVTGGAIVAAADATVVIRSNGAAGTILLTLPLLAGVPVPLSIFGLFSAVGENLWIATADAVDVTGRVLSGAA